MINRIYKFVNIKKKKENIMKKVQLVDRRGVLKQPI